MSKSTNQKQKILYLMDWLLTETDEGKGLSMSSLIAKLDGVGISAERKSLVVGFFKTVIQQ